MKDRAPRDFEINGRYAWYVVGVLMFAYIVSFVDRLILGLLIQPIKQSLQVGDIEMGLLAGIGFALFYTVMGIPLGRLADSGNRKWLIITGASVWTLMTAASAFAESYTHLLIARIGVGVGEATLTPAAMSMIADYFSRDRVSRAIGAYSIGLYLGAGIALLGGSVVVQTISGMDLSGGAFSSFAPWQLAFLAAATPGIAVVLLMLTVREPPRQELSGAVADARVTLPLREVFTFMGANRRLLVGHFIGYGLVGTAVTAYLVWAPEMLRRSFDIPIGTAGFAYGMLLLTLGALGPFMGGWWAQRAAARGEPDAEIAVSIRALVWLAPFAIAGPLSIPQGLAPAVLQLVSPNRMRGQVLSAFVLCAVIFAYTIGPTAVPFAASRLFGDENALDKGMALVGGLCIPLGALALAWARRPFGEAMRAGGRSG
jgi:MFS family permease